MALVTLCPGCGTTFRVNAAQLQAHGGGQENALRNQCDPSRFDFSAAHQAAERDLQPQEQADTVVANILANPLIILAPILTQAVRKQGHIVLSGILKEQAEEVRAIYQQWFDMRIAGKKEDWVLLTGVKR